jgi:hypothetical protein
VLAGGVAPAFSVKRTVGKAEIIEACEAATELHKGMVIRGRTIREETVPPVIYGLLGDSHDWKSPGSTPEQNVIRSVGKYDDAHLRTPREALDLLCIADLDCWSRSRMGAASIQVAQGDPPQWVKAPESVVSLMSRRTSEDEPGDLLSPLTIFITTLWQKLALNDPTLQPIADGLRVTYKADAGEAWQRTWPADEVLSEATRRRIAQGVLLGNDWQNIYY